MKIKGEKVEVVTREVYKCAGVKCDICGKVIPPPKEGELSDFYDEKHKYYSVVTGHHDWGNDSEDSIERRDVCEDCIMKVMEECFKRGGISKRTGYIEVETEHVSYFEYIGG